MKLSNGARWQRLAGVAAVMALLVVAVINLWNRQSSERLRAGPRQTTPAPAAPRVYGGPPARLDLTLRVEGGSLALMQATPRRDGILPLLVGDHAQAIASGLEGLYDYRILSSGGTVLAEGSIVVPLRARTTYPSQKAPHYIVHEVTAPLTVTTAAIPYNAEAVKVDFTRVTPDNGPEGSWKRSPAGQLDLTARAPTKGGSLQPDGGVLPQERVP